MADVNYTGNWRIGKVYKNESGEVVSKENIDVYINPVSVVPELVQRVNYTDTVGGTAISAWSYDPLANYSGYSRFSFRIAGVAISYTVRGNVVNTSPSHQTVMASAIANNFNITIGNRNELEASRANEDAKAGVFKDIKRNAIDLFTFFNAKFVDVIDGETVYAEWEIDISTPLMSPVDFDNRKEYLSVVGIVTTPFTLNEDAGRPYMPTWSVGFTVFDEDVESVMNHIKSFSR